MQAFLIGFLLYTVEAPNWAWVLFLLSIIVVFFDFMTREK